MRNITKTSTSAIQIGRGIGKTSLMTQIIQNQTQLLQLSIDRAIIDVLWPMASYRIHKTWHDRRGRKMHRISVNHKILSWLYAEHSQYGISNPDWWVFDNKVNITDKLFTLLVLQWSGEV